MMSTIDWTTYPFIESFKKEGIEEGRKEGRQTGLAEGKAEDIFRD
jgi:flagellar biosynthesis/type III secretory pathway protein FliH